MAASNPRAQEEGGIKRFNPGILDRNRSEMVCLQTKLLCVAINHLVRLGIVVVVGASNASYLALAARQRTTNARCQSRSMIRTTGTAISWVHVSRGAARLWHIVFFVEGATGKGRTKPDVLAPGDKIPSAAAGQFQIHRAKGKKCEYVEDSGTSMAAARVSGVIAGFVSVGLEFVDQPKRVKQMFVWGNYRFETGALFSRRRIDLTRAIQFCKLGREFMQNVARIAYAPADLDRDGAASNKQEITPPDSMTDGFVTSHGCNNLRRRRNAAVELVANPAPPPRVCSATAASMTSVNFFDRQMTPTMRYFLILEAV